MSTGLNDRIWPEADLQTETLPHAALRLAGGGSCFKAAADPQGGELFLNAVLREALGEGAEVDLV
jgi:hypothetical protein